MTIKTGAVDRVKIEEIKHRIEQRRNQIQENTKKERLKFIAEYFNQYDSLLKSALYPYSEHCFQQLNRKARELLDREKFTDEVEQDYAKRLCVAPMAGIPVLSATDTIPETGLFYDTQFLQRFTRVSTLLYINQFSLIDLDKLKQYRSALTRFNKTLADVIDILSGIKVDSVYFNSQRHNDLSENAVFEQIYNDGLETLGVYYNIEFDERLEHRFQEYQQSLHSVVENAVSEFKRLNEQHGEIAYDNNVANYALKGQIEFLPNGQILKPNDFLVVRIDNPNCDRKKYYGLHNLNQWTEYINKHYEQLIKTTDNGEFINKLKYIVQTALYATTFMPFEKTDYGIWFANSFLSPMEVDDKYNVKRNQETTTLTTLVSADDEEKELVKIKTLFDKASPIIPIYETIKNDAKYLIVNEDTNTLIHQALKRYKVMLILSKVFIPFSAQTADGNLILPNQKMTPDNLIDLFDKGVVTYKNNAHLVRERDFKKKEAYYQIARHFDSHTEDYSINALALATIIRAYKVFLKQATQENACNAESVLEKSLFKQNAKFISEWHNILFHGGIKEIPLSKEMMQQFIDENITDFDKNTLNTIAHNNLEKWIKVQYGNHDLLTEDDVLNHNIWLGALKFYIQNKLNLRGDLNFLVSVYKQFNNTVIINWLDALYFLNKEYVQQAIQNLLKSRKRRFKNEKAVYVRLKHPNTIELNKSIGLRKTGSVGHIEWVADNKVLSGGMKSVFFSSKDFQQHKPCWIMNIPSAKAIYQALSEQDKALTNFIDRFGKIVPVEYLED